jgi:hypothetical protein
MNSANPILCLVFLCACNVTAPVDGRGDATSETSRDDAGLHSSPLAADAGIAADSDVTTDAGIGCGVTGPQVRLDALRAESVRRLSLLLGASASLDVGKLYFQEMVSNAELNTPAGDQSALLYVPDAVPVTRMPIAGFPTSGTYRPAVLWGLNGVSRIIFTDVSTLKTVGVDRRFAVGALFTLRSGTPPGEADNVLMDLKTRFGADGASWSLLAGGVIPFDFPSTSSEAPIVDAVEGRRYEQTLASIAYAKSLSSINSVELNGAVYPVPIRTWPAVQLQAASGFVQTECLRGESRYFRDYPGAFGTLPSLAAPFGDGLKINPKPSFDGTCFTFGRVDKACWEDKHRTGPSAKP